MTTTERSAAHGRTASLAVAALVLNAGVWGLSWWPFRQLQGYGLHPLWATATMYLMIVTGLLVSQRGALRGFLANPPIWALAVFAGMTNVCFNWAVTLGDVVRVVLLFYLMPAWSVLVAWALLGEKPRPAALLRLALAMTGVLIVLKTPDASWPVPQSAADWLALAGGFSFAITNALLRKYRAAPGPSRMLAMFGGSGVLAFAVALSGLWLGQMPAPALQAAGIPMLLGLTLAFMASNAALLYGAARLAAGTTAIVMLTEILFASGSAAALGAAEFSPRIVLGGSLIVLAAVLAAISPSPSPPEQAQTT